jgi:titin
MTVTSLPNALQASWQALSSGLADHYVVQTVSGDGTTCVSTETSCVVSELDNGVSQTLQISAYDDSGMLIFQTLFQPNSPKDVPDAPLQVSAVPGDASATIRWSAPNDQGSAITLYTVTNSAGKTCQTSGTSCSITNLVPGASDRFTVRATNGVGTSIPSEASEYITISATPVSPTGVSVAAGDKVLVVTWSASNPNRGSAISFYTVTDSQGHTCTGTPETLRCTLLNVTNNVSDVVTVTATNGDGLTSVPSVAVTAVAGTVSSAPLNLVATSGWVSTTFTWSAPETDGGSPIVSYVVTSTDGATCTAVAPLTSCSILNLIGGSNQKFSVVAVNAFGSSMASNEVLASAFDVPSRPTNVSAALQNNGSIIVQWTAPSNNGSAISGYTVTSNFGDVCTASGTRTSCTFSGLTKGNGYSFTVVATNGAGDSLSSAATSTVVDAQVPDAPSDLAVDAGDHAVLVWWSVPADNGSRILSYIVTASTGQSCETDQTSCLIADLTNGTSVTFTVVAINGAGSSAPSGSSPAVIPAGAPSVPANLQVVSALHGSVTLRWDAASGNGSPVIGYVVSDAQGQAVCTVTAASCTITGLTNGKTYTYTVSTRSNVGESDRSIAVSARPITVPTTPSQVSAVAGAGAVTIRFSQPVDDGGSIVTGYTVTDKYGSVCSTSTATSCRFTGLANGVVDTFTVTASNAAGTSVAAVVSATPLSAPSAPENVKAIALNGSALVSWDAALANGSPVSSYLVTSADAKGCLAKAATSCLVSGLTNGTAYSFTVMAFNAVGVSSPSVASAAVTPATSPSAPRSVVATVGDKFVTFTWSAPARNGGSAVVGYSVSSLNGESCTTTIELTCTITNLTNGQSYEFVVTAQNAVGISAPSKAVSVVPIAVPSAPKVTSIVPVARGLKVSFNGPADTGGSPITRYQVSTNGGLNWQTANLSSVNARNFDIGSLTGGTTYGLTIRAFNAAGVSSASTVVYALYIATPGAPSLISATVSGTTAKVQYKAPTVTGGQAPSMYQYSLDGGVTWRVRPAGTSTEFMLTNLPKSTTLKLCIRAVNSRGYGTTSKILTLRVK